MPRSLLGLLQVVVIAKILIYFSGLENARRQLGAGDRLCRGHHRHRVVVSAVLGEAMASFFLKGRST